MERVSKWLTVLQVVVKVLVAALAAVAADTAAGDPLRGVVHRAAEALSVVAVARPAPSASLSSLLVLPQSARVTSSV